MNEQVDMSFWMWVLSGVSGVISGLILIIYKAIHKRIDDHEEEVKGEMMKNDRDHKEFWQQFKEAAKERETHCISRMEYEKDIKHMADAITEMKGFMKSVDTNIQNLNVLMVKHMAGEGK